MKVLTKAALLPPSYMLSLYTERVPGLLDVGAYAITHDLTLTPPAPSVVVALQVDRCNSHHCACHTTATY